MFDISAVMTATVVQAFVERLHKGGRRWVPIIDPAIKVDAGYPAYEEGLKEDIFIKAADGKPYLGQVPCASSLFARLQQ